MKKIILIILAYTSCLFANAQRYMHYYMNDGTYFGFYTNEITSVDHYIENGNNYSSVYIGEKNYKIPINNIDSVAFEGCSIGDNDFIGKYRIYELNYDDKDSYSKKVFVDNRAMLLASKNGDFGANDTILLTSICNDIRCMFITDSKGYISKLFDGETFLYFDWEDDTNANIIKLNDNGYQIIQDINQNNGKYKTRSAKSFIKNFFFKQIGDLTENGEAISSIIFGEANNGIGTFFHNLESIRNDPELHNLTLWVDGLFIAGDIAGIAGSIAAGVPTTGLSWLALGHSINSLFNDINNLMNNIWPDDEQMKRYKDYYQNKYNIRISTLPEENVTYNSAKLNGSFTSLNGINGELFFTLFSANDNKSASATAEKVTDNSYLISGNAIGLKPGELYIYYANYKCTINGLEFIYQSDNQDDFMTLYPSAHTGEVSNIEAHSAEISCTYYNVPDGATCGVEYTWDGGTGRQTAQSSKDGEKFIRMSSLKPNTEYSCRAYVEFEGTPIYAENTTTFTTKLPDISGEWNCTETHYDRTGNPTYKTYTITLEKEGGVKLSDNNNIISSFYSLSETGEVSISITDIATQTTNSGMDWSGQVDDINDPQKITGSVSRWNFNQIGFFQGESYDFEMTR